MANKYRGAGVIRWMARDGKSPYVGENGNWWVWDDDLGRYRNTGIKANGSNSLILGFWSDLLHYQQSDAGIPVVKRENAESFKVYKLIKFESTFGTFDLSEWEEVKSETFIYMQEAYIERLQATIVTAERIEALNIITSRIKVIDGAKVGNWNIEQGNLYSEQGEPASIMIDENGGKFLRINEGGSTPMIAIRSDDRVGISIYTQGYNAGKALGITAQTGAIAIESHGSHTLHQRGGEVWNAPGVLLAIDIVVSNIPSQGTGSFNQKWGITPLDYGVTLSRSGRDLRLNHNLGHSNYFVTAFINAGAAEMNVGQRTTSYCDISIAGSYSEGHTVTIMIFGRNKI